MGGTLLVNGDHSAATGQLMVASGAILGGIGVIGGNAIIEGSLTPGASIGTLSFNSALSLAASSATVIETDRLTQVHDRVKVAGTVALAGTLVVTESHPELLEAGDHFRLIEATAYSGSFGNYDLPELDPGLGWNTSQVASNGTLWVVGRTPPVIGTARVNGTAIEISATGGTPGWPCHLVASSDLTVPMEEWVVVATGIAEATGGVNLSVPVNTGEPALYYRLRVP
jgi:hypothetical protein